MFDFADVENAGANFAPVSITLTAESIALIGMCLDLLSNPASWTNGGSPLTDSQRDDLDQWIGELIGVYTT